MVNDTPDPSVVGEPVAVSYTVTANPPGAGTPTGNVTVNASTGESCTNTVALGTCNITFTTVGTRNLTATYAGDTNFAGSGPSAPLSHTVNQAATTTMVTGDTPDPSVTGEPVAVSYTVTANPPGAGTPTGNVTVNASTGESCTNTVAIGSCSITFMTAGPRNLTATYAGDTNFAGSGPSAPVPHTVNGSETTITLITDLPDPDQYRPAIHGQLYGRRRPAGLRRTDRNRHRL